MKHIYFVLFFNGYFFKENVNQETLRGLSQFTHFKGKNFEMNMSKLSTIQTSADHSPVAFLL